MVEHKIKIMYGPSPFRKRKVKIFVDKREISSGIIEELGNYDCEVKEMTLAVGDYILSDRVVVERKSADDFLQSIINQRLFKQLKGLKDNYNKPVLILEGNSLNSDRRVPENVIRGALASVALDFSVPILWTRDISETAGMIFWIAQREQLGEKRELAIRGGRKSLPLYEQQEFLVAGLPGISNIRSREMLKYFKTPADIFLAEEKELIKVKKIGKVTAKNIRKVLNKKYKNPKRKKRK